MQVQKCWKLLEITTTDNIDKQNIFMHYQSFVLNMVNSFHPPREPRAQTLLVTNVYSMLDGCQLSVSTRALAFTAVSVLVVFHDSCRAELSRNSSRSQTSAVTSSTDSTMTSWSRRPAGSAAQLRRVDRRTGVTTSFWGLSSSPSLTLPAQWHTTVIQPLHRSTRVSQHHKLSTHWANITYCNIIHSYDVGQWTRKIDPETV